MSAMSVMMHQLFIKLIDIAIPNIHVLIIVVLLAELAKERP